MEDLEQYLPIPNHENGFLADWSWLGPGLLKNKEAPTDVQNSTRLAKMIDDGQGFEYSDCVY